MSGKESANANLLARKMTIATASGAILIAILGLVAHIPGLNVIDNLHITFVPMALGTCISFIPLGFIILASLSPIKRSHAYFYIALAFVISLFGLTIFTEYCCIGTDKISEKLFLLSAGFFGEVPVRIMAPATGLIFFMAGIGTIFLMLENIGGRNRTLFGHIAGLTGCVVATGGLVFVLSYAYGEPLFYEKGRIILMAVATAPASILLGMGIATASGEESFPLQAFTGPSVRAMMMRIFIPLISMVIFLTDISRHITSAHLSLHPNSIISAALIIIFMIVTATIIERLGGTIGRRIEKLEKQRLGTLLNLKNSEALFSMQFEVANVGLAITSLDKKWVRVNTRLCNILGYTADELKQKTWGELTCPGDLDAEIQHFKKVLLGEIDSYEMDKRLVRRNGEIVFVHLTVGCVRNSDRSVKYFIASFNDITEHKRADEKFRSLFARHEAILAEIPDIVMEVDTNHVYTWANPAGYAFFGEDVIGKEAAHFVMGNQDTYSKVAHLFNGNEKTFYLESWQRRKDGEARLLAWWYRPLLGYDGRVIGALSSARDITEQKKIEQELADYRANLEKTVEARTGELVATRRELHDARRLADIGALSATLAHEIRNPLAGIKAATYLIAKKGQQKSLEKHITIINKKIGECDHIIRNFLGYARIAMPKHEPVVIAEVLQECLSSLNLKYSDWKVVVRVKFNCEKNQIIEADSFHLTHLFSNIIDNAYMSFENKTGTIDITFDCDEKANSLIATIKDSGCGIAEENLPKLFDPFFTTRARGVGLGLSVCKQVVELHRGKIDVKSRIGEGTEFRIALPLKKGQECLYNF